MLTQGPQINLFEEAICCHVGAANAVAVSSASAGLHVACAALGIDETSIVWTVPNSFVSTANCALHLGATIDFVDIELSTGNICVEQLASKLADAEKNSMLPNLVISVHFAGQPTNQSEIHELSRKYNFLVLEDCSHSLGAKNNGETVGSCLYSDACVFSFHALKIITTGEGGAITTNNNVLAKKMRLLSSHGIEKDYSSFQNKSYGNWYYEQHQLGWNYRITDFQAALGKNQISRLEGIITERNDAAQFYDSIFKETRFESLFVNPKNVSSYHLYVLRDFIDRDATLDKLKCAGYYSTLHYYPIHLQPFYQQFGFKVGDFPNAEYHAAHSLSIPLFPGITIEEQEFIASSILD